MSENTTNVEEKAEAAVQEEKVEKVELKEAEPEVITADAKAPEKAETPAEKVVEEKKSFFKFRSKEDSAFSRDEWILQNIKEEDMMEYLQLEYKRMEFLQNMKEIRSKRILRAFELTVCLAAVVAMTYFLKDNPTILISVLYTLGIIGVFWIWKNPKDKK